MKKIVSIDNERDHARWALCFAISMHVVTTAKLQLDRILAHFIETGWLRKAATHRAFASTPPGAQALARLFDV